MQIRCKVSKQFKSLIGAERKESPWKESPWKHAHEIMDKTKHQKLEGKREENL